jgi:hypothetical protein
MYLVKFIRLERKSTNSWLTIKLPKDMEFDYACSWAEKRYPNWMAVSGSYSELE